MTAPADSAAQAFTTSAFSLKALAAALQPLMEPGGSLVGLDFDASVAWPIYDWMGVAKAALESVNRYLARDLGPSGIRCNLVSAGPLGTVAAQGIPGFEHARRSVARQAPLGWDVVRRGAGRPTICWLLSDYSQGISGEIVHVDGGFHAVGAATRQADARLAEQVGVGAAQQRRDPRAVRRAGDPRPCRVTSTAG